MNAQVVGVSADAGATLLAFTKANGIRFPLLADFRRQMLPAYGAMVIGFAVAEPGLASRWIPMLFLYVLCITSALALGAQEERLAHRPRDDRGLRLGAGLAEGGETGIAYSVFLLLPDWLPVTTTIWVGVLALTVVLRTILAHRLLR